MRATLSAGAALIALALVGCDDTLFYAEDGGGAVPTGTDFCAVTTIIENNCLGCHNATALVGDYDLETDPYTALTELGYYGVAPVIPGDPEGSILYQKVTNTQPDDGSYGGVMPPGTSGLSAEEADIIYQWIADGALEACDSGGTTDGGTTDGGTTDGGTTGAGTEWEALLGIFDAECLGCHGAAVYADFSYLDLETDPYTTLFETGYWGQVPVIPGDPEGSLLYRKVVDDLPDDESLGAEMPPGSGGLPASEAELIYSWIANGATQDSPYTGGTTQN